MTCLIKLFSQVMIRPCRDILDSYSAAFCSDIDYNCGTPSHSIAAHIGTVINFGLVQDCWHHRSLRTILTVILCTLGLLQLTCFIMLLLPVCCTRRAAEIQA